MNHWELNKHYQGVNQALYAGRQSAAFGPDSAGTFLRMAGGLLDSNPRDFKFALSSVVEAAYHDPVTLDAAINDSNGVLELLDTYNVIQESGWHKGNTIQNLWAWSHKPHEDRPGMALEYPPRISLAIRALGDGKFLYFDLGRDQKFAIDTHKKSRTPLCKELSDCLN